MRILFDHNVPKQLRRSLPGHFVSTSRELGWDTLRNGDLLEAGELKSFDIMVTADHNLSYQQNLAGRKLALIVLDTTDWNVFKLNPAPVSAAILAASPSSYQFISTKATYQVPYPTQDLP